MSLADPKVFATLHDDGSADFTISIYDEDHKFSASPDGQHAKMSYEETLTYRGKIRVSEPEEEVWNVLMKSDEMTEYLEENDLSGVQRRNL